MRPIGPGSVQSTNLLPTLQDFFTAIQQIQTPTAPVPLWSVLFADLPPAADWPAGSLVWVSDKGKVGVTTGAAWTDTTGGAL